MTARMRLAALYTGLFLAAGSVLIAIVYALVRASLPSSYVSAPGDPKLLAACKQELGGKAVAPDPAFVAKCKSAFRAGAQLGASAQRGNTLHDLLLYSIVALAATTVLAGVLGWIIAGRMLRPVHAITATARRASDQHLGERLALSGPHDELRELADTFDDMLDRLDRAFDAQRRFVANASHELRTPLTVMRTALDVVMAKPAPTPADYEAMAATVRSSLTDAEELISALLTLARSERGPERREPVDLATCCTAVLHNIDSMHGVASVPTIHADLEPAIVEGDRVLLARMTSNLVDNALRYNVSSGTMHVRTETVDGTARLTVSNSGPPITADDLERLFEPFQRVNGRIAYGDGFGLGLSIVRAVATSHGGTVLADPRPGGGLVVRVTLPSG